MIMERFFNTEGPVDSRKQYCLPPLGRIDLSELVSLIDRERFFILHAPRQTGKTTCLLALMEHLNREARYRCLYVNFEKAQSAREDVRAAMHAMLGEIGMRARDSLGDPLPLSIVKDSLDKFGAHGALDGLLTTWAQSSSIPIVLLIDEIDALIGDTLISVLRQLRSGYDKRPAGFPQSIVLCGVRDVKDYRIYSSTEKTQITGGSAFNIKAESLRLGDFIQDEIAALYLQHTEETGQKFEDDAIELAWNLTQGQPWLVNALAYRACFKMKAGRDRSKPITAAMILEAKEAMIVDRVTHLDQLADKLTEPRVRRVIEPILAGHASPDALSPNDISYVSDLGLIRIKGELSIANPIYQEVIPRELTYTAQLTITQQPSWYVMPDGRIDFTKLIAAFQEFFRESSEIWLERFDYKEAGPHLLMQAFLQRIMNGGGYIHREYGLGRGRTDLLVIWPHIAGKQKAVIELKILHNSLARTVADGLTQTAGYMDRCGALENGHLLIFDRDPQKPWDQKIFRRDEEIAGRKITVWGM